MYDEIFEDSPRTKFYDILFNANKNLTSEELDKILSEFVALKILAKDIKEKDIKSFISLNTSEFEDALNSLYIEFGERVLSQNE